MFLIDTNILLEVLLKQKRMEQCIPFLSKVINGQTDAVITDFAIDAIVIKLEMENRSAQDIRKFLKSLFLYKGLKIHSISLEEKVFATELMETYKLDFDDAIQAQAALSSNINKIVSFDPDFDIVKELTRLEPDNV